MLAVAAAAVALVGTASGDAVFHPGIWPTVSTAACSCPGIMVMGGVMVSIHS